MMGPTRQNIDAALRRLSDQERLLTQLRADYAVLRASKFFALHHAFAQRAARKGQAPLRPAFDEGAYSRLRTSLAKRTTAEPSEPIVSIVIPVHNNAAMTIACLQSIADTWFETLAVEIIVADDASNDETCRFAGELPGITVLRSDRNLGFLGTCNRAAQAARGRYLCFLNNDTIVRPAWLDELVTTAEDDGTIGVVGAKLVYPDGRLQEAGGIIFADGSGANYGRGGDPADSRYNFVRDVDYVSGAALLVRTSLFHQLGRFDATFSPAYYEDADLCFAVRAAGYRVVYQPRSEVVHFEGASNGTEITSGHKRYQEINRPKFTRKWAAALASHASSGYASVPLAARRIRKGQTVLVVDSYVPMHDREAGSSRLFAIIKMLRSAGFHVVFLPDNYAPIEPYTSQLQRLGVEVLHHLHGGITMEQAIDEVLPILDFAWICRPQLFDKYYETLRRNSATRFIYDTIDLHFVRERRALETLGIGGERTWKETFDLEMSAARKADATITVSEEEAQCLRDLGIANLHVIPTIHEMRSHGPRFQERAGLLFIGNYNHAPNSDAATWLCSEIMPLVRSELGDVPLTLLGSNPTPEVRALASSSVAVPGYVEDIQPYFETSRVFVAPLRFGAGHKGKVGQSLSFGLPVVMTDVAAEGFGLVDEREYLRGNTAEEIASAIVRLYADESLWNDIAAHSREAVGPFTSSAIAPRVAALLGSVSRSGALA